MNKLMVLQSEERQDEERFRETMAIRDHVLEAKREIESMEKRSQKIQQEIRVMEASVLEVDIDIKMLETQTEEIKQNVKDKAEKVMKYEDKLKSLKSYFQKFLRNKIAQSKEILKQNQENNNQINPAETSTNPTDKGEEQRKIWSTQGEMEALALIDNYLVDKVEEINNIITVIGDPFVGELEQNNVQDS